MNFLALYQAADCRRDQPGYYEGFERLVTDGQLDSHFGIPYRAIAGRQGWSTVWDATYRKAKEISADVVFLQFLHDPMPNAVNDVLRLRELTSRPLIVSSLGDGFGRWAKRVPSTYLKVAALCDLNFLTGMGHVARKLASRGARNVVLMPNGCCQVRFSSARDRNYHDQEFDVAFIGNRIVSHNPVGLYYWASRRRAQFVQAFSKRYGRRFGLFGNGWNGNPCWQGPVEYGQQHQAYWRAEIATGGSPNVEYDYYTSDRAFIALASGVPFVDYHVRGVERLLEPGRFWWLGRSAREMSKICDSLLHLSSDERMRLGTRTREHILSNHTQYHRCAEMIEIIRHVRCARMHGQVATIPTLSFLRDPALNGYPPAIVAWQG